MYDVAVSLAPPHFSVEGRLTVSQAGNVELSAPPAARPAGTDVAGFLATDDRGLDLRAARSGGGYVVAAQPGAVRFRYRLDFQNAVAMSSTGAGLDATRLYAVSRSVFLAPDPAAYRKTSRTYPVILVHIAVPAGWHLVTSWGVDEGVFAPAGGEALLGATISAAPDFRVYRDTAGGAPFVLAIRGQRHFGDSALVAVIAASLRRAAAALGPVPVPLVTYTSDTGWKGRTSGSLQGLASVGLIWEPGELLERARSQDLFHETLHLWFGGALETVRWWTEGVTDYYAARLYAEWTGHPGDLADLCYESLENYLQIKHNTMLTMEQEDRGTVIGDNTALLVYRKGMLAGLLLDAAIRRGTDGHASLDDVARRMVSLARERRTHAVTVAEIRDLLVETGGGSVERVWDRVVAGATLISEDDVTDALRVVTGDTVAAPAPRAKERKVLSNHPNS
jgi:predicted metalloprotease with PDZ domain